MLHTKLWCTNLANIFFFLIFRFQKYLFTIIILWKKIFFKCENVCTSKSILSQVKSAHEVLCSHNGWDVLVWACVRKFLSKFRLLGQSSNTGNSVLCSVTNASRSCFSQKILTHTHIHREVAFNNRKRGINPVIWHIVLQWHFLHWRELAQRRDGNGQIFVFLQIWITSQGNKCSHS